MKTRISVVSLSLLVPFSMIICSEKEPKKKNAWKKSFLAAAKQKAEGDAGAVASVVPDAPSLEKPTEKASRMLELIDSYQRSIQQVGEATQQESAEELSVK